MKNFFITGYQNTVHPRLGHALILAAPLWASGLVFLAVLFAVTNHGDFYSLQFVALSLGIVMVATMTAFRVMDRDMQFADAQRSPEYRRLKLRSKRLRGSRFI